MKRSLLSFATDHYRGPQQYLGDTAAPWFDEVSALGADDLDAGFRSRHAEQLAYKRGFGFWAWKPWLILRALRSMKAGDVLMYCDSQLCFVADPAPLLELCRTTGGPLLFHQKREKRFNRQWTRRDCYFRMGCDAPLYWDGIQLNSAASVWRADERSIAFLEEWYRWCSDLQVVGDFPSVLAPEFPEFRDHRHDQSIASLMAIRDDLDTWPDPTQFGNGYQQPGRNYGQVLEAKRTVGCTYPIPCLEPAR